MECRARRSRAVFKISIGFHTPCGRPAVAAADPEGFAHSAAAEGSSAGEERQKAIWSYVSAYVSAGGDMELRFCMFERRRRYGVTFLHIAAPAAIWTYVSAYRSVAGEVDEANVAVARVWRTLRVSAA